MFIWFTFFLVLFSTYFALCSITQLNWIVLHGGNQLSPAQHPATAGNLQMQWHQLQEQKKRVVSTKNASFTLEINLPGWQNLSGLCIHTDLANLCVHEHMRGCIRVCVCVRACVHACEFWEVFSKRAHFTRKPTSEKPVCQWCLSGCMSVLCHS